MRNSVLLVAAASIVLAAPLTDPELPSGVRATLRVIDYVNTEHEPLGQTFRAILESELSVAGKVVAPAKSRALLRLVAAEPAGAGITLDWFAFRLGEEWWEMRVSDGAATATRLAQVEDRRLPEPEARPILMRGQALYIPAGSALHFELMRPVRLVRVGRERASVASPSGPQPALPLRNAIRRDPPAPFLLIPRPVQKHDHAGARANHRH